MDVEDPNDRYKNYDMQIVLQVKRTKPQRNLTSCNFGTYFDVLWFSLVDPTSFI